MQARRRADERQALLNRTPKSYASYLTSPTRFNREVLKRPDYWARQIQICKAIADPRIRTVLVPSGNSTGKSFLAAGIALWHYKAFPGSKTITTGPSFGQLLSILWAYIQKTYIACDLCMEGDRELWSSPLLSADPEHYLVGINPQNIESASGYHGEHVMALVDESSALTAAKNEAINSWNPSKRVYIGNPLRPDGPFYEMCSRQVLQRDPSVCLIRIPSTESPAIQAGERRSKVGFADLDWLDDMRREYGEHSPWWQSHVLAQFPDSAEGQLVARDWIDRCVSTTVDAEDDRTKPVLAIDLGAGRGGDRTVLLVRTGRRLLHLEWSNQWSLEDAAGKAAELARKFGIVPQRIVYDRSGLGEGFGALLRNAGITGALGFLGGSAAVGLEKRFENLKAAAAWNMRNRFNPAQSPDAFAIPHEWGAVLRPELQAYTYEVTGKDKIKMTDKDIVSARLGRSPDLADALIMSYVIVDRVAA